MESIILDNMYTNMPCDLTKPTRLIEVFKSDLDHLSQVFMDLCMVVDRAADIRTGHYQVLPTGKNNLLVLLFGTQTANTVSGFKLWVHVKICSNSDYLFFKSIRGQEIRIYINEIGKNYLKKG